MAIRAPSRPVVPPTVKSRTSPELTPNAAHASDGPETPSNTPRCSSGPNSTVNSSELAVTVVHLRRVAGGAEPGQASRPVRSARAL